MQLIAICFVPSIRPSTDTIPLQMIYATATWTWRKRIVEIELYNEPELEACWDSVFFVQQSAIRRATILNVIVFHHYPSILMLPNVELPWRATPSPMRCASRTKRRYLHMRTEVMLLSPLHDLYADATDFASPPDCDLNINVC